MKQVQSEDKADDGVGHQGVFSACGSARGYTKDVVNSSTVLCGAFLWFSYSVYHRNLWLM